MMFSKIDFGKGIGPLKHHADAAADLRYVLVENVLAVQRDLALDAGIAQRLVDPVQIAQKGGLAAARRPDQRRDLVCREFQRNVVQRLESSVVEIHIRGAHLGRRLPSSPEVSQCWSDVIGVGLGWVDLLYRLQIH